MNTKWSKLTQSIVFTYTALTQPKSHSIQMPLRVILSYFDKETSYWKSREMIMNDVSREMESRLNMKCGWQYLEIRDLDEILDQHIKPLL